MKKKTFLFYLFAFMGTLIVQAAPQLPSKVEAFQPSVLNKNIIYEEKDLKPFLRSGNWGQDKPTTKYWTVYSDRSSNTTYNGPSTSSGKCDELEFNERVRIAKIEKDFALVYTEKLEGTLSPAISSKATSRGWVPMKNLLLWESCPVDNYGVYNKALIVINIEHMKGNASDLGRRYDNPDIKTKYRPLQADANFYFVMKSDDNGMVLLARECKMQGYSYQVLFGWVNKYSFAPWSQRTCLEPNWAPDVVKDLGGQKIDVRREGKKVTDILIGRENKITQNEATKHRLEPQLLRYPLLKTDREYLVTAFSRPDGTGHVPTVPIASGDEEIDIKEGLLKNASIINLIVVIDGTRSMENYYKPIQEAVKSAYQTFGTDNKTVRVGIVIYRDYADGEYLTERLSMRKPTDPSVAQFLETGGKYGIKSSVKDHTNAEALYKGLEVALDAQGMGYDKANCNLMFVVGDCGNDENDRRCLSQEAIIEKCVANHVQLMAFQVRNENDPAYLNFRKQMNQIVKGTLTGQQAFNVDKKQHPKGSARMVELADGYEYRTFNLPNSGNLFIGGIRNADLGKEMEIQKLNALIKDSYSKFAVAIDARSGLISNIDDIIADIDDTQITVNSTMELGALGINARQIEALKKNNSLMAFNGEVSIKSPNGQDYWQPIIYISSDEFHQLIERLRPVRVAAADGNRKPYVEALKALIRSMVPEITEEDMNAKDVKEIMALVAGLNVKTGSLGGRTLIQIQDENIVDNVEFQGMIAQFNNKFDKLAKINENKYPFSVERNKTWWYWIPVSDLP